MSQQHNSPHPSEVHQSFPAPAATEGGAARPASLQSSIWFAFKAVEIRLRFILILAGIGLVIGQWDTIRNYWDKWTRPSAGSGAALSATDEFYCPMHPSVVREQADPGGAVPKCPICGMPLSKRKKGDIAELPEGIVSRVQLSPFRVQAAGIKTADVAHRPMSVEVRAPGYVAVDERRLSRIVVRAAGFVEKLYVNESFATVAAGDPLAEVYSPELSSAAQELLIARRGSSQELVEIAREKLRLLGVARQEIEEILRTGKATSRLVLRATHRGQVFDKQVVEGDEVKAGQMLFEVADLSTVWIEGEVYEKDAALLRQGQAVQASVEAFPERVFEGRVYLVHPHVETATRTMRVRFELDNPGSMLRPGMFATVRLQTPIQEIEPFRSLLAGASGDEPSTTTEAALIASQKICPVTGAKLGSMGKPVRATADGETVFLCCAGCEAKLKAQPAFYRARLHTVTEEGVLAVPEQAVIDTGTQKIVYVEREPGLFEGVVVTLGPSSRGYYAVIDGLLAGDRVAAAGAFLIDAETRLNPAAASAYFGASGSPTSGGPTSSASRSDSHEAAPSSTGQDKEVRENLARLTAADRQLAQQQRTCPISGEPLGSMGVPVSTSVSGQRLLLCCEGCQDKVNDDPQGTLTKLRKGGGPRK